MITDENKRITVCEPIEVNIHLTVIDNEDNGTKESIQNKLWVTKSTYDSIKLAMNKVEEPLLKEFLLTLFFKKS